MNSWLDPLLATFFPVACHLCGALVETLDDGVACAACWLKDPNLILWNKCARCGYPFSSQDPSYQPSDCHYCRTLTFQVARSCGLYEGALRANLLNLKIQPTLCGRLKTLLNNTFNQETLLHNVDLIIPIPLHSERLKARGFNQAEILASEIAKPRQIVLDTDSLARIKSTAKHRMGMDIVERQKSLTNAFQVLRPRIVKGKNILLVDDLFTTGSTISAAAETLKAQGVGEIKVLTLARVTDKKKEV